MSKRIEEEVSGRGEVGRTGRGRTREREVERKRGGQEEASRKG